MLHIGTAILVFIVAIGMRRLAQIESKEVLHKQEKCCTSRSCSRTAKRSSTQSDVNNLGDGDVHFFFI